VESLLGYEVINVSCGSLHVIAVTNDNEVFAWGKTDNGKYDTQFSPLNNLIPWPTQSIDSL